MLRTERRSYLIIFLLSLFCASQAIAQSGQQLDIAKESVQANQDTNVVAPVNLNKEYFSGYLTDTKNIVSSPARWDSTDWLVVGAITGVAVGLFTQDDQIERWVQKNKNNSRDHLSDDAKNIWTYSIPALAGLGIYGFVAPNEKAKTTFLLSAESFIVTGAFVQVLKRSTGRSRPYTGRNHDTWSGPSISGNNENLSFPSGDASSAFAIASVVALQYDNIIVPIVVYTGATAIGLERIYKNGHWTSDVFVGSLIGYFTGKAIVDAHKVGKESRLSLTPMIDRGTAGMLVTYRY